MRFACSPITASLMDVMVHAWTQSSVSPLALLDASMLERKRIESLVERHSGRLHWVFEGSSLESLGDVGAVLLSLPAHSEANARELISLCQSKPALALIWPQGSLSEMVAALQWLAWVETADGSDPMHCRFADTRVTPSVLVALRTEQQVRLARGISKWCWPDRLGSELRCQSFEMGATNAVQREQPFDLNAQQFAGMLVAAEPDMVFQMLQERMPDIVPPGDGGAIHVRLCRLITAARMRGLEDLPDLFQFVVLGLTTFDEFHAAPALQPAWREWTPQKQRFADWVNSWPDALWAELESHQPT